MQITVHHCTHARRQIFMYTTFFVIKIDHRKGEASGSTRPAKGIFKEQKQELCNEDRGGGGLGDKNFSLSVRQGHRPSS